VANIHQILEKYWGFKNFRPLQEDIILSILSGKDTLALLPTGGGKSICFQVPAMALEGICIVITPLIALMKDQVENLKKRGIKATAIYSGMSKHEIDVTLDNCAYDNIKFLYCSPERLKTDIFLARVKKMKVALLAIDEAHCISQWGYDFRPPYLEISVFRELIPGVPCIALTASATEKVCSDIQEKLSFKKENIFRKSFARKNLSYSTFYCEDKENRLLEILNKVPGTSVVYVRNRNRTQQVAQFLQKNYISADYYHAGLNNEIRDKKQKNWVDDKIRVIVSTNAFGMGIDKPNVRTVIHLDLPDSPEAYYQEAGRAGRDEKLAYAVLLYNQSDIDNLLNNIQLSHPEPKAIKQTYQALANYFKLAVGSGFMQEFDFDINAFCSYYSMPVLTTHYCLKKLENQGFIQLNEAYHVSSKIHFLVDNETLYKFQVANKNLDAFIKIVLRIYGGELFNRFVNITEKTIASKIALSEPEVRKMLKTLDKNEIISYAENTGLPKITFLTARENAEKLPINVSFLAYQKKQDITKATTMVDFAQATNRCRTLMILNYFDELSDEKCGICDFCIAQKKILKQSENFKKIRATILSLIANQKIGLDVIKKTLAEFKKDDVYFTISEMLDVGEIKLNDTQQLYIP
jgi:ATP-dependent DNA helicase RecQ